MRIQTLQYSSNINSILVKDKIAVVIDVFRATSVIITALAHGAKKLIVTDEIQEALTLANQLGRNNCILGGERKLHMIDGFDYGNSPQSYINNQILNKSIILTTTNGTKAINFCQAASEILICSFLNCKYVASSLINKNQDVVIVCAGSQQQFALEDSLCAGMILFEVKKLISFEADDFSLALMHLYQNYRNNINEILCNSHSVAKLKHHGYEQDINFCLQTNIYNVVPHYNNNEIII